MNQGIFVGDQNGHRIAEWFAPGRKVSGADWAPDGSSLIASVEGQLVKVTADGIRPVLPADQEALSHPTFSPDGRLAAVQSRSTYDIVSVDPDGGGWECLLCDDPRAGWGSTGVDDSLVFRLREGERFRVFIRAQGEAATPISDLEESASCPVLSPDGASVAYLAQIEGAIELRVRARDGGEPVTLARDLENSEFVSWSPDGASIAFAGGSPLRVWVVSAAGGTPRAVSGPGGDYPSWSPDGETIAFAIWTEESDPNQGTWVVPSGGGESRKVSDLPTRTVWDPRTGDLLQLRRSAGDGGLELWRADRNEARWTRRSRLDLGVRPPIQIEYLPLTVDPSSGRLVMNRRTGSGRLVVFDGVEFDRW
jgi:hypothetical protein